MPLLNGSGDIDWQHRRRDDEHLTRQSLVTEEVEDRSVSFHKRRGCTFRLEDVARLRGGILKKVKRNAQDHALWRSQVDAVRCRIEQRV